MKYLVLNDIHFGMNKNNDVMLNSLKRLFNTYLIPKCEAGEYDGVFILGDLVQSKTSMTHRVSVEIDKIINALSSATQVYILIGNHDLMYDHNYTDHSLERFRRTPNVTLLEGNGVLNIDNTNIVYCSYNKTDSIMQWFEDYDVSGDLFIGHVEMDGNRIYNYVNDNFKLGLSGHIHDKVSYGNFHYLSSLQEHTFAEMGMHKGWVDLTINDGNVSYKEVANNISSKFKKIVAGDVVTQHDIENNYLEVEVDMARVRANSKSKNHSQALNKMFNEINQYEPACILRKKYIDSEDTTKDDIVVEVTLDEYSGIEDIKKLNFNDSLYDNLQLVDIGEYKEETLEAIGVYLKEIGKR